MTNTANLFATRPGLPVILMKAPDENGCPSCHAEWFHVHDALSILTHEDECEVQARALELTYLYYA